MIEVQGIQKSFGKELVLKDIRFQLEAEKTLSILGKSGCGKTTLLKILAGLESEDAGKFEIGGENMLQQKAQNRGIVYLSQEPLLFPHLDVFENIAFGLRLRKLPNTEINQSVEKMLSELGLESQGRKRPDALSGGQKQRAAFGRAAIIRPKVLLLDEPFGSLDNETRADMQALFQHLRKIEKITSLFVTHDLREALTMGDQFGRMEAGVLELFPDRSQFLNAADVGMKTELDFWRSILVNESGGKDGE